MNEKEFKKRTQSLALRVIRLVEAMPNGRSTDVVGRQLVKAATSVGANYRAACRGKSAADMLAKLALVEEEADETLYGLELLAKSCLAPPEDCRSVWKEANEIVAMTVASLKTLRIRRTAVSPIPKSKIQSPQ